MTLNELIKQLHHLEDLGFGEHKVVHSIYDPVRRLWDYNTDVDQAFIEAPDNRTENAIVVLE